MLNPRLAPQAPFLPSSNAPPVEWRVAPGLTAYADAVVEMEDRAGAIAEGRAAERVYPGMLALCTTGRLLPETVAPLCVVSEVVFS